MERFWNKVNKTETCWNWTAFKNPGGYGVFRLAGKVPLAHRVSYELCIGPIPPGKMVLHSCDNRACVNPSHLSLGDQFDNMQQMYARGRHKILRGEDSGVSPLNNAQVLEIREKYKNGISVKELSTQYGIAQAPIRNIVNRKTWRHI